VRRLRPDNPRFQRLSADDRLIVSEPFSELPGTWREIPQETVVTVALAVCWRSGPFAV